MSNFRRRLMCKKSESDLPSGYTRLNYLESTGTQHIVLNQGSSSDMILKFTAQYTDISTYQAIIGGYNSRKYQLIGNNSSMFLFIQYNSVGSYPVNLNKFDCITDFVNNKFTIYDTEYDLSWAKNRDYLSDFYLFWARDVTDNRKKAKLKLYKLEIYRGEELSLNLIPSLDTQGTPCLYDTVSKKAFYNQGTGEFLYG